MPDTVVAEILKLAPVKRREVHTPTEFTRKYRERWSRWHSHVSNETVPSKDQSAAGSALLMGVAPKGTLDSIVEHLRKRERHLTERGVRFFLDSERKDLRARQRFVLSLRPETIPPKLDPGTPMAEFYVGRAGPALPGGVPDAIERAARLWLGQKTA